MNCKGLHQGSTGPAFTGLDMSALPPKADMCSALGDVCFVAIADIALINTTKKRAAVR